MLTQKTLTNYHLPCFVYSIAIRRTPRLSRGVPRGRSEPVCGCLDSPCPHGTRVRVVCRRTDGVLGSTSGCSLVGSVVDRPTVVAVEAVVVVALVASVPHQIARYELGVLVLGPAVPAAALIYS